ncbi:MAG: WYL domain-containing protein [Rhodospirillaceae bacterium]|nr:WYL domain-containing protein [Rhodospirillaceae bacterium]
MPRKTDLQRLDRLEMLTALLAAGSITTVADLAMELGVSPRTVSRDIELLRTRDLPIDADRGRGGGLRLHRNWSVGNVHLQYREAIDVLLGLAIAEKLGTTLFLGHTRTVRHKLAASFSAAQRDKIRLLRKRVLVGARASDMVMSNYRPEIRCDPGLVLEAFFEMKRLEIWYAGASGARTQRLVEPQYLFLNWPVWYLLAWDHLRADVRFFRLDRIHRVRSDNTGFRLREEKLFRAAIEGVAETI